MDGVLALVKPPGMTSHDCVDFLRRITGLKAGHAGTLDPAAAGLLLLCLGKATRLSQYLIGCDKAYRAEITFGISTDTGDAEGQVVARAEAADLEEAVVREALARLVGEPVLPVPRYSAVKSGGRPLHRKARRGAVEAPPERTMRTYSWTLRSLASGPPPVAVTDLECASGTYVRSLMAALAHALHTEAYLSFLVRTRVGRFRLEQAWTMEEIEEAAWQRQLARLVVPPAEALAHLPALTLDEAQERLVRNGAALDLSSAGPALETGAAVRLLDEAGGLIGIARAEAHAAGVSLRPETILTTDAGSG
jgi:tRNA pseudouridine55 synthase